MIWLTVCYINIMSKTVKLACIMKENISTKGCSKLKRSGDKTSSVINGINIRTNASPKWDRIRCPEEKASSVG